MKQNTIKTITAILFITLTTGSVRAASRARPASKVGSIYFVDQNHPQASDSNPGSETEPWLTVGHAAAVVQAGDTVKVKPGFYPERVVPANSGTAGNPITFQSEPRRSALMYGFYTVNSDYLRIKGFSITTDPALTGWTERYGIFIRSDHVEVVDNYLYNLTSTAIQGYWHDPYPQNAYIADNKIYHSQMGLGITGYSWLVENNEVERLFKYSSGDSDYSRFFGDDHIIRGNKFHGMRLDEIGSAHVDCFQTFDNNGEFAHNVLIEGNLCMDFHQGFMGEAHYYHNIDHITFQNNVFAHGWAWGLAVQDISYLFVYNNTFVDIQHHGVGVSGPHGHHAVIKNNIFYDTGTSYWFPDNSNSTGDFNLIFNSNDPPVAGLNDLIGVDPEFVDVLQDDFHLMETSPGVDTGETILTVNEDFEGTDRPQGSGWDRGAFEYAQELSLYGIPGDQSLSLNWVPNFTLEDPNSWQLSYAGPAGDQTSPISISADTLAYQLTGLTNYASYLITLEAISPTGPFMTATLELQPMGHNLYLPFAAKLE